MCVIWKNSCRYHVIGYVRSPWILICRLSRMYNLAKQRQCMNICNVCNVTRRIMMLGLQATISEIIWLHLNHLNHLNIYHPLNNISTCCLPCLVSPGAWNDELVGPGRMRSIQSLGSSVSSQRFSAWTIWSASSVERARWSCQYEILQSHHKWYFDKFDRSSQKSRLDKRDSKERSEPPLQEGNSTESASCVASSRLQHLKTSFNAMQRHFTAQPRNRATPRKLSNTWSSSVIAWCAFWSWPKCTTECQPQFVYAVCIVNDPQNIEKNICIVNELEFFSISSITYESLSMDV